MIPKSSKVKKKRTAAHIRLKALRKMVRDDIEEQRKLLKTLLKKMH